MRLISILICAAASCAGGATNAPAYKLAKYYPDGQIQSGALWTNGAPTRTFFEWYPNGQMKQQLEMKPPWTEAHGWGTQWDEEGYLRTKILYRDGKALQVIQFHGKSNLPESVNDTRMDSHTQYYPSGVVRSESINRRGPGVGRWFEWYEDGKQKRAWHYFDGKLHGLCLQWHRNGQRKEEQVLEFGKRKGSLKYWNETGEPTRHPSVDSGG